MIDKKIYLDNAATTPLSLSVIDTIKEHLQFYHNPSSHYQDGIFVKNLIESARMTCAEFLNTTYDRIFFTPSGSASNTLAIKGYSHRHVSDIFYLPTMHKSALMAVEHSLDWSQPIKIDSSGRLDMNNLRLLLKQAEADPFVVVEYANSEIGTIQNLKEISDLTHLYNGIIYADCTGSIATLPCDVTELGLDMASFSGHKIGALKGISVLYKRPGIELEPRIYGSQEGGLCGGTENVLGILSVEAAVKDYTNNNIYSSISSETAEYVWNYIENNIDGSYLVGDSVGSCRLPHNLYVIFKGVNGEELMTLLDQNRIQVSTGSACNSGNKEPSNTLVAVGVNEEDLYSGIRMTFSGRETKDELDYVCKTLKDYVSSLRMFA